MLYSHRAKEYHITKKVKMKGENNVVIDLFYYFFTLKKKNKDLGVKSIVFRPGLVLDPSLGF